ncbi:hypothetical protein QBC42DRAFT_59430 [Cladorrhinum samala]|uniref:Uncharacterized protein n=1 Tax=Cladorrhinum samala TaxID=585594 RepID=A0AAV9H9A4_9PEZI|nr:hypothetical protein QBC42DRAFT_59430 [Cladorrhinum samala]
MVSICVTCMPTCTYGMYSTWMYRNAVTTSLYSQVRYSECSVFFFFFFFFLLHLWTVYHLWSPQRKIKLQVNKRQRFSARSLS